MWHTPLPILAEVSTLTDPAPSTMWHASLPWWEFILRGVIIYAFLIILLRITGKRQVGQLAPFDLVLLLVLSNAVQNAMNGGDNSVTGGIISATTLIVLNGLIGRLTYKSKKLERVIEGRPDILIHNGKVFTEVLERQLLTHHELNAALRAAGCSCPEEVHYAILENTGQITVQPRLRSDSVSVPPPASTSAGTPTKPVVCP
jgi:uncharacterized membrane protein YcaP (DUF421 family)